MELIAERGVSNLTIEEVAQRSGVAKTTIYRRHADRESVLRAALAAAIVPPDAPVGVTPRERIRWALDQTWGQMTDVLGRGGLAAILRDDDARFTGLFRSVLDPYADALVELIRADVATGDLRSDLEADTVVSMLVGAYLGELVRRGRVDEDFSSRCVDLMWVAMTGTGRSGSD